MRKINRTSSLVDYVHRVREKRVTLFLNIGLTLTFIGRFIYFFLPLERGMNIPQSTIIYFYGVITVIHRTS